MNKPVALTQTEIMEALTLGIPLYTHPHPDNLGLALSIIDQQKLEIEKLKAHPAKELTNIVVASATCSCGKVMEVTNLQPVKELTSKEIMDIGDKYLVSAFVPAEALEFAKAILRKARE